MTRTRTDQKKRGESSSNGHLAYWKKQIEKRIKHLEREGFDVKFAKDVVKGKGITKDIQHLVSLDGELLLLSSLESKALHGDRVDFSTGRTHLEVWTPMSILPQRKLVRFIEMIVQTLRTESKCLHQITYSPWKTPSVIKYEKWSLPEGPIQFFVEVLFDIQGFQPEVGKLFMKEIRRRKAKFYKESKRGGVVIDITHLTVVDPAFLSSYISQNLTIEDAEVLDGVCLRVLDLTSKGKPRLIVIPNVKSGTPLSEDDFSGGSFVKPYSVPYAYAISSVVDSAKRGSQEILARTEKGELVINGKRITLSLASEGSIGIVSLFEKPNKLKKVAFQVGKRKTSIGL